MNIREKVETYRQYIIDMRRDFHSHPEVAFQEKWTSQRIIEELEEMGLNPSTLAQTGVVATIEGKTRDRIVGLRSDMDALEVVEKTGLAFASQKPGKMHACGHDTHMAMLLGAAKVLNDMKSELRGSVRLIFQPAEEVSKGADLIIKEGALEGVSNIFGIHIIPMLPKGTASVEAGARMSSADSFEIIVTGKGGHGGMPQNCIDPIVAASGIVMNLQSITSRENSPIEPLVITVGQFHSGTASNVIANTATLKGTVRCFNEKLRDRIPALMDRVVIYTARSYGAEAECSYIQGVPPVVNEESSADRARQAVKKTMGIDALVSLPPATGADDFALYLQKVPGTYLYLGGGNPAKKMYTLHNEKFDIDEDAMTMGSALHVQYALDYLNY